MIIVSSLYNKSEKDFIMTLIHERIHSYRDLLVYYPKDEYVFQNGGYRLLSSDREWVHVDASQEVLQASIDDSLETVHYYENLDIDTLEDLKLDDNNVNEKKSYQHSVDEAMVELITILCYSAYTQKKDLFELIHEVELGVEDEDIQCLCRIILRHGDFELFKWMFFPIEYTMGDYTYDYFKSYTKNDSDLLEGHFRELDLIGIDDDALDREILNSRKRR